MRTSTVKWRCDAALGSYLANKGLMVCADIDMSDVPVYPDGTRDLSCRDVAQLVSFRRDRLLDADEQKELRYHLAECLNCTHFDHQLELLSTCAAEYAEGSHA